MLAALLRAGRPLAVGAADGGLPAAAAVTLLQQFSAQLSLRRCGCTANLFADPCCLLFQQLALRKT